MCLGIPGKVAELFEEHGLPMAMVDFGGVIKSVCTAHVPDLEVGEYTLVHVGFALTRIDEREARQVFEFLDSMNQLDELRQGEGDEIPG
jgi:hydrogenase expression/formation protein HypC